MENEAKPESDEKELVNEVRKEKIKNWFNDPYNLLLVGIILFAVILRIYWFFKIGNQPLWWDEANYMDYARTLLGASYWKEMFISIDAIRPIAFPLMILVFTIFGLGESSLRIFTVICSIIAIPFLYYLGRLLLDKKSAIIACFALSIFWSFSFYSFRLLVDIQLTLIWIIALYLFFNAYINDKSYKSFIFAGFFMGLAFLTKYSSFILIALISIYLLLNEKASIFKNKKIIIYYIAALITVIPLFIFQSVVYHHPIAFIFQPLSVQANQMHTFFQSLIDQIIFCIKIIGMPLWIPFIIGLGLSILYILLVIDKSHIKGTVQNKHLFILFWLVLSFLFFGKINYGPYMEERYYFIFYPAIFLLAGYGLSSVFDYLKKFSKYLPFLLIGVLLFSAYQNIVHANQIIIDKKDSFIQLKLAGEWIKMHTSPEDKIMLIEEQAEVSYYSERNFMMISKKNVSDFRDNINQYKPKYIFLSFYYSLGIPENQPLVQFILSDNTLFKPVQSYGPYINQEQTLPLGIIFEVNYINMPTN